MLTLPEKTVVDIDVSLYGTEELLQYTPLETALRKAYNFLGQIEHESENPIVRRQKRVLLRRAVSLVQLCRMMLLHVACRSGSRILTTMFAADGRRQEPCKTCSYCARVMNEQKDEDEPEDTVEKGSDDDGYEDDDGNLGLLGDDDFDDHELMFGRAARSDLGDLIEDPVCPATNIFASKCRHYIHDRCLHDRGDDNTCYHCEVLQNLVKSAGTAATTGGTIKLEPKSEQQLHAPLAVAAPDSREFVSTNRWGQQYSLNPSVKMNRIAAWVGSLPKSDKFIIFSYFRSFLDLMEAMLARDGVPTCRFDGDTLDKAKVLADFRESPATKFRGLLATISSGGIGLNITAVCMSNCKGTKTFG